MADFPTGIETVTICTFTILKYDTRLPASGQSVWIGSLVATYDILSTRSHSSNRFHRASKLLLSEYTNSFPAAEGSSSRNQTAGRTDLQAVPALSSVGCRQGCA